LYLNTGLKPVNISEIVSSQNRAATYF